VTADIEVLRDQEYAPYGVSSDGPDYEGPSGAPDSGVRIAPPRTLAERRERGRQIAAAGLGALITAFALLNLGDVKVHWLIATGRTPLIVVIAVAFLFGVVVDRLVIRARRKRSG
jgi:uncharacterized integral membrane protein